MFDNEIVKKLKQEGAFDKSVDKLLKEQSDNKQKSSVVARIKADMFEKVSNEPEDEVVLNEDIEVSLKESEDTYGPLLDEFESWRADQHKEETTANFLEFLSQKEDMRDSMKILAYKKFKKQLGESASEAKVNEEEKGTYRVVAKSITDKNVADKIAQDAKGRVVADVDDEKKFMVLVGESKSQENKIQKKYFSHISEKYEELKDRLSVIDAAHNMDNVIAIWWYRVSDGFLEIQKNVTTHADKKFDLLKTETADLEKGRLLKYKGDNILMIYSTGFRKTSLTEDQLEDLVKKMTKECGCHICCVINDKGENLYENKIILIQKKIDIGEKIVKVDGKWQVQSSKGKNMGTYETESEAKKRLRQIEFFKHRNENVSESINAKKMVPWSESEAYKNDSDFENEEEKDVFYSGELFDDNPDYILKNSKSIPVVQIGEEILFDESYLDASGFDLTSEDEKLIIDFYNDNTLKAKKQSGEFIELSTWPQDIKESDRLMKSAPLAIKYRGGQGSHYGWWILKKDPQIKYPVEESKVKNIVELAQRLCVIKRLKEKNSLKEAEERFIKETEQIELKEEDRQKIYKLFKSMSEQKFTEETDKLKELLSGYIDERALANVDWTEAEQEMQWIMEEIVGLAYDLEKKSFAMKNKTDESVAAIRLGDELLTSSELKQIAKGVKDANQFIEELGIEDADEKDRMREWWKSNMMKYDIEKKAFVRIGEGRGTGLSPADVDREELRMGLVVEFEHIGDGTDPAQDDVDAFLDGKYEGWTPEKLEMFNESMRIAMDHLAELPDYYTRLNKMEEEGKNEVVDQQD